MRAYISRVTFSDGTSIALAKSDIVVVVGPNNAGKSATLKGIGHLAHGLKDCGPAVLNGELITEGRGSDLVSWLKENTWWSEDTDGSALFKQFGVEKYESLILSEWEKPSKSGLKHSAHFLFHRLRARDRPYGMVTQKAIRLLREAPTHPIHLLQTDVAIEARISGFVRKGFGMDIAVHRNAGLEVPLLCGEIPHPQPGDDRLSPAFLSRLDEVTRIEEQGDGVRSFVSLLLHALVTEYSCLLIDEPEAFLHPPQARLIGQLLAKEIPQECQTFIATHGADVVKGLLLGGGERIRILHLGRSEKTNLVRELKGSDVSRLWSDPMIRHSNVLDGLFHSTVFICESESDCRFYSALLDATAADNFGGNTGDFLLISSSGKYRLHVATCALRNVGVRVGVIADFDLLREQAPFQRLIESCGMEWMELASDWHLTRKSVEECKTPLDSAEVKRQIMKILDGVQSVALPEKAAAEIRELLTKASSWRNAKRAGVDVLPSGESYQACKRLLGKCAMNGLFILEHGELECFCREIGGHGPEWVNQVLQRNLRSDLELEPARNFVGGLRKWAIGAD